MHVPPALPSTIDVIPMTRVSDAAAAVAFVLFVSAAAPLSAQLDSARSRPALRLSAGLAAQSRFDATASPVAFAGDGFGAAATYERQAGGWSIGTTLSAAEQHLAPTAAGLASRERLSEGWLRATALRPAFFVSRRAALLLGVAGDADVAVTEHGYTDPRATVETFLLGMATIGPAAEWRQWLGGGVASVSGGVPIAGVIEHPYADIKVQNPGVQLRGATVSTLRNANGEVSFTSSRDGRVAMVYAYTVRSTRLMGVQSVRGLSQALSVGVLRRFR
jgi:hypothetical protein